MTPQHWLPGARGHRLPVSASSMTPSRHAGSAPWPRATSLHTRWCSCFSPTGYRSPKRSRPDANQLAWDRNLVLSSCWSPTAAKTACDHRSMRSQPDEGSEPWHLIELGEAWPGSGAVVAAESIGWHADQGLILLVADGLSDVEMAGLQGPMDVVLVAHDQVIGLLLQIEGFPDWMEAWSWRHFDQIPPDLQVSAGPSRVVLTLVVVDQASKIVQVIRAFTLSLHASRALRREVAKRWTTPVSDQAGVAMVQQWYAAHSTGRSGLRDAVARCKAGQ